MYRPTDKDASIFSKENIVHKKYLKNVEWVNYFDEYLFFQNKTIITCLI